MGIKPWPTLTLLMEGGPDDGLIINMPAEKGPEPPEELLSAVDPMGGCYVRHPEPAGRSTWTYQWQVTTRPDGPPSD